MLELILWNKAPVELQREIKEITVGSVQELLHKLLRVESTLQQKERWLKETGGHTCKIVEKETTEKTTASPRNLVTSKLRGEINLKHAKCFNCYKKCHLSKFRLEPNKKPAHRVLIEESESEEQFVKRDQEEC